MLLIHSFLGMQQHNRRMMSETRAKHLTCYFVFLTAAVQWNSCPPTDGRGEKYHIYSIIFLPTCCGNYSAQLTVTLLFCFSWQRKSKLMSLMKLTPKISIPTCRTSLSTFPRTVSVLWSSRCCCFFQNVEFQKAASEPHSVAYHSLLAIQALKHVNVWVHMHILVFFFSFLF